MTGIGLLRQIGAPLRVERDERIDSYDLPIVDFEQSFSDIRRINRFLGGTAVVRRELEALVVSDQTVTMLDLGTGTADIPLAMIRRTRSHGGRIQAVALDANPTIIQIAKREANGDPDLKLMVGNAVQLPFADGSFDFVTCSLTFHHFSDSVAVSTLREMHRVARHALIVNDLQRGYLPACLIWLLTRLARMHSLTRHDGPLSVMRSRTLAEYRDLGARAGFPNARIRSHPFWRAALVVTKEIA